MPSPLTLETVQRAPKVLLHDHLDGGLRPATVIELADAVGHRLPASDPAALQAWFTRGADTRDILQYLATFGHTVAVLQTAEALERVAYEAVRDLAADGVVYAEVRFAPELHVQQDLTLEGAVEAVTSGYRRGEADARAAGQAITVNAILCAMRTETRSTEIAALTARLRDADEKVVAFDIAGAETGFPPSLHAEALALARRELVHITIHASEPPDLELIHDAVAHGAERIGHGVRLVRDVSSNRDGEVVLGRLAQWILDHQITLEMAPTCNVQIGAVPTLAEHPIGQFLPIGMRVTVNTDNRLMSGVSVTSEVAAVADAFGWGWGELEQLAVNGADSAFIDLAQRRRLVDEVIRPGYAAARAGAL
ncbi:MAG TPA: adenosine deaminase [Acidimicrobiales bacterium]